MNNQQSMAVATKLCGADMSCGYISIAPVLGNRDELIYQRLAYYCERLKVIGVPLMQDECLQENGVVGLLLQAADLTCADILSDAIALNPVLYDRNEKIFERLLGYFVYLRNDALAAKEDATPASLHEDIAADLEDVLPESSGPNDNMPQERAKKKKKRR